MARRRTDTARERGAVIPFVAISLVLLIVAAALAVDVGRRAVHAREARVVADLAALDAAREIDGSTTVELEAPVAAEAWRSAQRNGFAGAPEDLEVTLGVFTPDGVAGGTFTPTAAAEVPNAVQVRAAVPHDDLFLPGGGPPVRSAIALGSGEPVAAIGLWTTLAAVDTTRSAVLDALLSAALGGSVALDVVDWQTLADTSITLGDLAVAMGLGPDEVDVLLDTVWEVDDLVGGLAGALAATPAGPVLGQILVGTDPGTVRLGDLIGASLDQAALRTVEVRVLDLLQAAASASVVGETISVPLAVAAPGITLVADLTIGDPPHLAVGPVGTTVTSAQVEAVLRFEVADPLLSVPVVVQGGSGQATITAIECADDPVPTQVQVQAGAGLATVGIGEPTAMGIGPARVVSLALGDLVASLGLDGLLGALVDALGLGGTIVSVDARSQVELGSSVAALTFPAPFDGTPQQVGVPVAPGQILGPDADLDVVVVGTAVAEIVDPLRTAVLDVLTGTLGPVLDAVVPELLGALGASVGVADVSVPWALCAQSHPVLVQ